MAFVVISLLAVAGGLSFVLQKETATDSIDQPPNDLGMFGPVAGHIVYDSGWTVDTRLQAIDPSGPSDAEGGSTVAGQVAPTFLDVEGAIPLGWSSDGTQLLFRRTSNDLFPKEYLYVLHADGSETKLNQKPMYFAGASISPDGSRVVFAAQADHVGAWVVDTAGGQPVRLPLPGLRKYVGEPTFSPDGNQVAYLEYGEEGDIHVWVMDMDHGSGHEILTDRNFAWGPATLQWSPAGDRLAMQIDPIHGDRAIYGDSEIFTFGPDGSDFMKVITGGLSPYWSPDGSQIAYTTECGACGSVSGLVIAGADGSTIRAFNTAASGPWHPGVPSS